MLDDSTALDSNPPAKKRRKAKAAPAPAKKKAAPKAKIGRASCRERV